MRALILEVLVVFCVVGGCTGGAAGDPSDDIGDILVLTHSPGNGDTVRLEDSLDGFNALNNPTLTNPGPVTVVFTNSPATVLRPQDPGVPLLSRPQERVELLKERGVDLVVPLTFDLELSYLRATEFLAKQISALELYERIRSVIAHPRPFVHTKTYFGPDRRRRLEDFYSGTERRADDEVRNRDHDGLDHGDLERLRGDAGELPAPTGD